MFKPVQLFSYCTLLTFMVACNSNPSSSTEVTSPEPESSQIDTFSVKEPQPKLSTGTFQQTDVQLSGDYTIEMVDHELTITLSKDFKHDSGPDLFIALVKPEAESLGIYDFNKIPETDKIILGDILTQSAGTTRVIPLSQEQLTEYQTVLIQCVKWNHTYGIAPLTHP